MGNTPLAESRTEQWQFVLALKGLVLSWISFGLATCSSSCLSLLACLLHDAGLDRRHSSGASGCRAVDGMRARLARLKHSLCVKAANGQQR